jgi:hypothetical protein
MDSPNSILNYQLSALSEGVMELSWRVAISSNGLEAPVRAIISVAFNGEVSTTSPWPSLK